MWNKFKIWLCSIFCGKVQKLETEEALLKAVAQYSLGSVKLDVLAKVSETITTVAMREKGKLDSLQTDVLNKALLSWIEGKSTPREFKGLFRGGK